MKRRFDRTVVLGVAIVFIVMIGNTLLAYHNTTLLYRTAGQVTHTRAVLDVLGQLLSTAKDAETGQRGFVITGDQAYLRPYLLAEGSITGIVHELDSLTRDDPRLQAQLPELRRLAGAKLDELRETIALRQNEGLTAADRMIATGHGKAIMDSLRSHIVNMTADEQSILSQRSRAAAWRRNLTVTSLIIAGALQVFTLAGMLYLLRRKSRVRDRAAAHALEQTERFRTTLASIGDAVITTDTRARVTFMNPVAEQLTGWRSADATGESLDSVFQIVNENSRTTVPNPAFRTLHEGVIVGLANHTVLIARDGTERPIDDSAAPIRGGQRIIGAVLVFRDITERRAAERQLREADQRKDEFLAVLAHELRNPLAPLRNGLEFLRRSPDDPGALEQVGGIMERQLQHMVRLIDDLLDMSRITGNRMELRREPVDIAAVVHSALETVGPLLQESEHALKLTLPPHPVYVDADRVRLAQAIANLLSNAIKYTDRGGRIWLTVERTGGDVVLTVRDTGIGIPADMTESIFDMFTQVDSSAPETRGGLGIGLSLVREIVQRHGGSVHATSDGLGKGSELTMSLPVVLAPLLTEAAAATGHPAGQPRRVLIADDNRDAASSLAMILRVMGHEVCVTHDGIEAITEGERFRPDIALLDIGMPKLNGYETARSIRAAAWGATIPLVALTGWGQEDDRRKAEAAGFDHHMVKPVEIAALEAVLNNDRR